MKRLLLLSLSLLLGETLSGFDECKAAIFGPLAFIAGVAAIALSCRWRLDCVKERLKHKIAQSHIELDERHAQEAEYEVVQACRGCPLILFGCCTVAAAVPMITLVTVFCKE